MNSCLQCGADAENRFCSLRCYRVYRHEHRNGKNRQRGTAGYAYIVAAERALGKPLPKGAIVHHVNGDEHDNRNSNLVICQDQAFHMLLHLRTRAVRAGKDPNTHKWCGRCRTAKPFEDFDRAFRKSSQLKLQTQCRECQAERVAMGARPARVAAA